MKVGQKLWTREELILAINLYCKLPYGQLHARNPEIIHLADLLGRSAGAVGWKLNNFASMDPSHQARGISGAVNAGKLDREIWNEFYQDWEIRAYESERLRAQYEGITLEQLNDLPEEELPRAGEDRERMVRVRVNQGFFRKTILASYNNTCCITGLQQPELLVASHIRRWADDKANRMNPSNGLALNALHDRAYEAGLITITPEYRVKLSAVLKKRTDEGVARHFLPYEGANLRLPKRFLPDVAFLRGHLEERFLG